MTAKATAPQTVAGAILQPTTLPTCATQRRPRRRELKATMSPWAKKQGGFQRFHYEIWNPPWIIGGLGEPCSPR